MIDTHCHLFKEYYSDIDSIVEEMDGYMIVAGCDDATNKEVIELVNKYDKVYGVIGIQPEEVEKTSADDIKFIEDNINNPKIVGIGEIGLDYHYGTETKDRQKEVFRKMMSLANSYNKPVVIHSRDAIEDTLQIIDEYPQVKCDMHCYSSSAEIAKLLVKKGVMFGIGGVLTFKNARKLVEVVENIPLENILLETDSPYLSPEPYRGSVNTPKNIYLVAKKISEIKQISIEEVLKVTSLNAIKQFDLPISL